MEDRNYEVPSWLKKTSAAQSLSNSSSRAEIAKNQRATQMEGLEWDKRVLGLEQVVRQSMEVWQKLEADLTLEDLRGFMRGDRLSLTELDFEVAYKTQGKKMIKILLTPSNDNGRFMLEPDVNKKLFFSDLRAALTKVVEYERYEITEHNGRELKGDRGSSSDFKSIIFKSIGRDVENEILGEDGESFSINTLFKISLNQGEISVYARDNPAIIMTTKDVKTPEDLRTSIDSYLANRENSNPKSNRDVRKEKGYA